MLNLDSIFSDCGPLAQAVRDFRMRRGQLEMAQAVSEAIEDNSVLVAEAGTGTGKTFAYLVPTLLSGGKVIISTGTKTLQDQLFNRDIPSVRAALKAPVTIALLKGRANYICHYRLNQALNEGRFGSREDAGYLPLIAQCARTSSSGDKSSLGTVPENAGVWPHVTSTRENCLGQECPNFQECFVMKARKQAQQADVVVVNHHLFFADVMLRDEGVTELLPACNTVIFDEAHQLPETASLFFGESVGTAQILELARDTRTEGIAHARDFTALPEAAAALDKAARDLRLTVNEDNARLSQQSLQDISGFKAVLNGLCEKLDALTGLLGSQTERSEGLRHCWQRGLELAAKIARWRDTEDTTQVRWAEVFAHSMQLNNTPLSIAEIFRKQIEGHARAWVFTSATLSVNRDFSHYQQEMGLQDAATASWDSPFAYDRQALMYLPHELPDPNSGEHTQAVIKAALPLIKASCGRAFMLFTSLRAMQEARDLLKGLFRESKMDYPLLVQGEGSRSELLERFRRLGNAVLVGSQSFWEGV
ncbi:MAG: ATP-dependent DNA helicase, partial [Burkholderiales bacterium]